MDNKYTQAHAYLQMHVGNYKAAEMLLNSLDEQTKAEGICQFLFGHLAMKQKDYSNVVRHYKAAADKGIQKGRLLVELALAKAYLLEVDQTACDILESKYADNPKYLYDVCRSLVAEGKTEIAEQILKEKEECFAIPILQPMYKKAMAGVLKKSGRMEEAIPLWEEIFRLIGDRNCGVDLMIALMKKKEYEHALQIAEKLIDQNLEDHVHYYCLCCKVKLLKALGDPQTETFIAEVHEKMKAVGDGQLAELIRPLRLAILLETGDKDGAEHDLSEWEKALAESDLSEEAVTEELKKLQEVRESL